MPRRPLPPTTRVCLLPACEISFPHTGRKLYCTTEHRVLDKDRRVREDSAGAPKTPCALDECDEPARGAGSGAEYCTDRHSHTAWRRRTGRTPTLAERTCAYGPCDVTFTPSKKSQTFCSKAHQAANRRADEIYRAQSDARSKAWMAANPDRAKLHFRRNALRLRGVTIEGYDALLKHTAGACWICRRPPTETTAKGEVRNLHVDHDHSHEDGDPAGVRGLLDTWCNTRLALVEDHDRVVRVRAYLAERSTYLPPPAGASDTRRGGRWYSMRLTPEQYAAMLEKRDGRCDICGEPERLNRRGTRAPLSVDHDHAKEPGQPGHIRGLLCNSCNSDVGIVENTTWFQQATQYLRWAPTVAQVLIAPHPLPPRRRLAQP